MHPEWLGSPQHFIGGLILAFVVALIARRWIEQWWLVADLADTLVDGIVGTASALLISRGSARASNRASL